MKLRNLLGAALAVALVGVAFAQTADNITPSATPSHNALNYGWNGAGWDRLQVDSSKNLKINVPAGCAGATELNTFTAPISVAAAASAKIITGSAGVKIHICSLTLMVAGANNVAITEGTGGTCGTGTAGIFGGTTAATGFNFAANGGIAFGNGVGLIGRTATNNTDVCILPSAATQVSGSVTYAIF
jgi:hypothetical protein